MGSKRLPGKVLMKLKGKTMLEHIINFLSMSQNIDETVIATTTLPEDSKIEELANKINVKCYRGSSENVLERFYKCAKNANADFVVRITADDPIIDPSLIDSLIETCKKEKLDYVSNVIEKSFPIGYTACEVFTFDVLSKLHHEQKDPQSLEHVTHHIRQNQELFKIRSIVTSKELERPNWRLTVDHKEDFMLIEKIFSEMYISSKAFEYKKLVRFLDENQRWFKINSKCK